MPKDARFETRIVLARASEAGAASVHAGRQGKGRHPLLSTSNLYRTRGLHEALGRAA
jgi:hypothetical protein